MTIDEVMKELQSLGNEGTRAIYRRHGASGDLFGVKIGDLKKILKRIKGDQKLALSLWDTNNGDAMYLAAQAADGRLMSRKQLDGWARTAWWSMLSGYAVPGVAADNPAAFALAMKWLNMKDARRGCCGWSTYAAAISLRPDEELDLDEIMSLLRRVESDIAHSPDRVRYCMNNFVISVGAYVKPLLNAAKATARRIGIVEVDMGETGCKVPVATDAISKIESMGRVGKKRKTAKC
ncbi:MAG: DNA alkylation repair protein [Planctomycetota bacterium]|nr:DNA alkylation repair protein [Planctomycetota bacterium]MDA1163698.1 DNA alkylation repair protein [Planctomycetota bacterium]